MEPVGISGGPPAAARVSEKAVVLPSVPATTANAPPLVTVIELTLDTAVAGRVMASVSAEAATEVSTPARKQVRAATSTLSLAADTAGTTAPPVLMPLGRITGAKQIGRASCRERV